MMASPLLTPLQRGESIADAPDDGGLAELSSQLNGRIERAAEDKDMAFRPGVAMTR